MARISTYAIDGIPTIHDKVIGTNVDDADVTMNYTIGDIIALVPGGSASVQSLNTLTGELNLIGAGGISISASGTDITITGSSSSGIQSIDGATGPDIDLAGKGGITITAVGNLINIDGSGVSGGNPGAPTLGVQYNDGSNFAAGDFFTVDLKGYANPAVNIGQDGVLKGQLNIFAGSGEGSFFGETRYYDAIGSGQYASWASPGQILKQSYAVALPENEPATGQVLVIDKVATPTSPFTSLWSTVGGSGADEKFKYDAADTQSGYFSDKVIVGGGLSGSVNTDVNGVKTLTISAQTSPTVNSIKVGNDTEAGLFEFTGSGVTMNNSSSPTVINFDSGITGVIGPNASVVGDITLNGALVSQTGNTFSFDLPKSGIVTSVTATAPIKSSGGTTPDISMSAASATDDGYLSSGDFATFNSKQDALVSGTNIKTVNGNSLLGSGNLAITATATPGGAPSNVQFHNANGLLDGDTQFTYNLDSVNKIATVKIGYEVSPSETYGVLRLDGNSISEGGRVEFRTGGSKSGVPQTVTVKAPDAGVDQVISLPETLPTLQSQVLAVKSINGSEVQTQWEVSSGGGGVTSIVAGTNVSISPASGLGDVTVNSTPFQMNKVIEDAESATQAISPGSATQILFGKGQTTPEVIISPSGDVTFNLPGKYIINIGVNVANQDITTQYAAFTATISGVPYLQTWIQQVSDTVASGWEVSFPLETTVDNVRMQLLATMSNLQGSAQAVTTGVGTMPNAPSSWIAIHKLA